MGQISTLFRGILQPYLPSISQTKQLLLDAAVVLIALFSSFYIRFILLFQQLPERGELQIQEFAGFVVVFCAFWILAKKLSPNHWFLALVSASSVGVFLFKSEPIFNSKMFHALLFLTAGIFLVSTHYAVQKRLWEITPVTRLYAWLKSARFDLIFLLIAGLGASWFISSAGLVLYPDSTSYLGTAAEFFYEQQVRHSLVLWPPGYPLLISIFMLFSPFPADAAAVLSLTLFVGCILVFYKILCLVTDKPMIRAVALFGVMTFAPFYHVFELALSDGLFAFCVICFLLLLYLHLITARNSYLLAAAFLAGYAAIVKIVGFSLVGSLILYAIFFGTKRHKFNQLIRQYFLPILISVLPLGIWFLRNMLLHGSLAGTSRISTTMDLVDAIERVASTLARDLTPLYLAIFCIFLIVWILFHSRKQLSEAQTVIPKLSLIIAGPYFVFLILSASISTVDIDSRFFPFVYLLLFVCVALLFDLLVKPAKLRATWVSTTMRFSIFVLLALLGQRLIVQAERIHDLYKRLEPSRVVSVGNIQEGFDTSQTAIGIGREFQSLFEKEDTVVFSVLLEGGNHFAPAFLYKSSVFTGIKLENVQFHITSDIDYQIQLSIDEKPITLIYQHLNSAEEMLLFLETVDKESSEVFLLISEEWLVENGKSPEAVLSPNDGFVARNVAPYWLFSKVE